MRSWREIEFRIKQELVNAVLFLRAPSLPEAPYTPLLVLPAGEEVATSLRGTTSASEILELASAIVAGQVPLLGVGMVQTGKDIDWRRDYVNGKTTPAVFFRRIPYLNFERAGDHKVVWELNRHQHLVVLAQAFQLTGSRHWLDELARQLESWMDSNPFHRGINWASALEVAFRALSWIWIYHLAAAEFSKPLLRRFTTVLYQHGVHLQHNLSHYFSPNTHLLGEAVALHALGRLFPWFPGARRWQQEGARVVREQMEAQVFADGGHAERSTYYHIYALDMFLFHAVVSGDVPTSYRDRIEKMGSFLHALLGPSRRIPFFGDDDGGRFFHPFGRRDEFGRATLAACAVWLGRTDWAICPDDLHLHTAWWLGPKESRVDATQPCSELFSDTGLAVMICNDRQIVFDAGPFGIRNAGHSHADTLSFTLTAGDAEILIDPGTYTYVGDPEWRDRFRSTAAHNTIRIQHAEQACPRGPFQWHRKPSAELHRWLSESEYAYIDASCRYEGFRHRRRLLWAKPDLIFVLDDVEGPLEGRAVEQFWHLGPGAGRTRFLFLPGDHVERSAGGRYGWRSRALGHREETPVLCVRGGARMAALIDLSGRAHSLGLDGDVLCAVREADQVAAEFSDAGAPRWRVEPLASSR